LIDYVEFDEELNFLSSFNVKEADFEVNLKLDVGKNEFNSNLSYENNSYGQSYINITTETFFTQKNMIFITEKSVFPFFFYQIPIIVATPGHVKKMREKFDLDFFDDLVDHSYDDIIDNRERLLRIVNEIKRLHSMKNQIKTYYQSNIDRLISNKNKMIELSKCYKEIEFFDGLKNLIR
jgi:hypothetical protein